MALSGLHTPAVQLSVPRNSAGKPSTALQAKLQTACRLATFTQPLIPASTSSAPTPVQACRALTQEPGDRRSAAVRAVVPSRHRVDEDGQGGAVAGVGCIEAGLEQVVQVDGAVVRIVHAVLGATLLQHPHRHLPQRRVALARAIARLVCGPARSREAGGGEAGVCPEGECTVSGQAGLQAGQAARH